MIVNHTLSYLQQGRKRLGDAQTRVVTGRQLLRSSDDPAQVERAMTLASELRLVQKQTSNLKISRDWLSGTDSALDQLNDLMIEASNVALRAKNDTYSESERSAMAAQVGEMLQNGLSIANAQQAGNYLFSGQQVKTVPFSIKGDAVLYQGDNATIHHMVELGQTMPINITGVSGKSGGILNMLTQLQGLHKSLAASDKAGIQSFLDNIDTVSDDIHTDQSAVGVRMQRIDSTSERLTTRETNLKQLYSQIVDADMAEVIAEMSAEEKAYEMSLATTARVMPRSLLDFLR
jgi:flagellar hook-associated protein 3 FlgL